MTPRRRRVLRRVGALLLALLLALVGAWSALAVATLASHEPLDPAYAGPAPLSSEVAARFAYPEAGTPPEVVATFDEDAGSGWTSRWVQVLVTSPHDDRPHKVQLIHFAPTDAAPGRRAAVIVSPILGGTQDLSLIIGEALARRGLHAAVVLAAESMLQGDADEARLERVLRTAVIDRRRALDWLETLPAVDPARLGAIGASLGGLTTTLLAAVEPRRVRASVILLAGGPLGEVIARSDEGRLRRYVEERRAHGVTDLPAAIAARVPSDPLLLAPCVDARRVLVFTARWDHVVPADAQARFVEALGRPERYALAGGHYTSAALLPLVLARGLGFLEERLAEQGAGGDR